MAHVFTTNDSMRGIVHWDTVIYSFVAMQHIQVFHSGLVDTMGLFHVTHSWLMHSLFVRMIVYKKDHIHISAAITEKR